MYAMLRIGVFVLWITLLLTTINTAGVSYNRPTFSPCATWQSNGTNVFIPGIGNKSLRGLFITTNDTIYMTGQGVYRIIRWNAANPVIARNYTGAGNTGASVFVTEDGTIYAEDRTAVVVLVWNAGTMNVAFKINMTVVCFSVFIDTNNTLYCSADLADIVIKTSLNGGPYNMALAAGNGTSGSLLHQLNTPNGIFVDINFNLYVADCYNYRIMRFQLGQFNGTSVAGRGSANNMTLSSPTGVAVDGGGNIFIVDHAGDRLYVSGLFGFRCLAGCSGVSGSGPDQLNGPRAVALDSSGNIFVTDMYNCRLQRFDLVSNSCNETTTNSPLLTSTMDKSSPALTSTSLPLSTHNLIETTPHNVVTTTNLPIGETTSSTMVAHTTVQISTSTEVQTSTMPSTQHLTTEPMSSLLTTTRRIEEIDTSTKITDEIVTSAAVSTSESVFALSTVLVTRSETTDEGTTSQQLIIWSQQSSQESTTSLSTSTLSVSTATSFPTTNQQPSSFGFVPPSCPSSSRMGSNCSFSDTPCSTLQPCQNRGTCTNTNTTLMGYLCTCHTGFGGIRCQVDYRPCKPNACQHHGACNETSNTTYSCVCFSGWQGIQCEMQINRCQNVQCANNGVCRPTARNYTCECLAGSYSGRYCEQTSDRVARLQIVAKSFAYVAIIAMATVILFVVILDILKYWCGINVAEVEIEEQKQKQSKVKKSRPSAPVRYVYINSATELLQQKGSIPTVEETTV